MFNNVSNLLGSSNDLDEAKSEAQFTTAPRHNSAGASLSQSLSTATVSSSGGNRHHQHDLDLCTSLVAQRAMKRR